MMSVRPEIDTSDPTTAYLPKHKENRADGGYPIPGNFAVLHFNPHGPERFPSNNFLGTALYRWITFEGNFSLQIFKPLLSVV